MPELEQKLESLQKLEVYLRQQVADLEEDRQQLYDLLRDDKKTIHELKIKLRTVELSEENYKKQLHQLSDSESKLLNENEMLEGKVTELEMQLNRPTTTQQTETMLAESESERKLKEDLEKLKKQNSDLTQEIEILKNKSVDVSGEEDKRELLNKIDILNKEIENEKLSNLRKISEADKEIKHLNEEILNYQKKEKTLSEQLNSKELQSMQDTIKISNLEKQLKDSKRVPVSEVVQQTPVNKDADKRKLMDNLASIMASMDDPNHQQNRFQDGESTTLEVKRLQRELEQLQTSHKIQLQEKEDAHDEMIRKIRKEVSDKMIEKEKELALKINEMDEQMRKKAGTRKSIQTENVMTSSTSFNAQTEESFFDVRAMKRAETQTSPIELPDVYNAFSQTEDVEIKEFVEKFPKFCQTIEETRKSVKHSSVQTEEGSGFSSRYVQVELSSYLEVAKKTMASQTSVEEEEKVSMLQRRLNQAEKEIKAQQEDLNLVRNEVNEKNNKLKTINKDFVRQATMIEDLSNEKTSVADKYIFLLEASKQEKLLVENELFATKKILEAKTKQDEKIGKESDMHLAETAQKLKTTEAHLKNLTSEKEEKDAYLTRQAVEINDLKNIIAEKDEEVKCLWADLNKIQNNFTNYVDASEKDCLELEGRVRELEQVMKKKDFELNALQEKSDKTMEKLQVKEDQLNDLYKNHEMQNLELQTLKKVLTEKEGEVKMILDDINSLHSKYMALLQDKEFDEKNIEKLIKELDELKYDLKKAKENCIEQTRQSETKQNKINILQTSKENLEEQNHLLEKEIDDLKEKLQKVELQNGFLASSNEQRMKMVASTLMREKQIKISDDNVYSLQIAHLKKSLENKDDEIKLLTDDLNSMHSKYLQLLQKGPSEVQNDEQTNKQIKRLNTELERKEKENVALIQNQDSMNKRLQQLLNDKEKIKNDLTRDKNSLLQELKEKRSDADEKEKQLVLLSRQLGEQHDQNELLSKQCSDLKIKLNLLGNSLTTSSLQNKELLMQCKSDENNLREMQAESLKKSHEEQKLNGQITSLKGQLQEALTKLQKATGTEASLRNELQEATSGLRDKKSLHNQYQQLLHQFQEKEKQLASLKEQVKEERRQKEDLQDDKKQQEQTQRLFNLLRKEYDDLATHTKNQSLKIKDLIANEKKITSKLKEKELEVGKMTDELVRCTHLSRKLDQLKH